MYLATSCSNGIFDNFPLSVKTRDNLSLIFIRSVDLRHFKVKYPNGSYSIIMIIVGYIDKIIMWYTLAILTETFGIIHLMKIRINVSYLGCLIIQMKQSEYFSVFKIRNILFIQETPYLVYVFNILFCRWIFNYLYFCHILILEMN